jgi:hypothetical protein
MEQSRIEEITVVRLWASAGELYFPSALRVFRCDFRLDDCVLPSTLEELEAGSISQGTIVKSTNLTQLAIRWMSSHLVLPNTLIRLSIHFVEVRVCQDSIKFNLLDWFRLPAMLEYLQVRGAVFYSDIACVEEWERTNSSGKIPSKLQTIEISLAQFDSVFSQPLRLPKQLTHISCGVESIEDFYRNVAYSDEALFNVNEYEH